jgi:hypothetical protein
MREFFTFQIFACDISEFALPWESRRVRRLLLGSPDIEMSQGFLDIQYLIRDAYSHHKLVGHP